MKKLIVFFIFLVLLTNFVSAGYDEDYEDEEGCSIWNLVECFSDNFITDAIYDVVLSIINAPIKPLVNSIEYLMTADFNLDLFSDIWAVIIYIISAFYGLYFYLIGFQFMVSGSNPSKRENAKDNLKNTVLMIVLVQASFFLYRLFVNISSILSSAVFEMIEDNFLLFTLDNLVNVGLQIFFGIVYVFLLLMVLIFLGLRYLAVVTGVVFLPIGIFLYFTPALKNYGKLFIESCLLFVFLPFFQSLILLCSSLLVDIKFFSNFKIFLMISALAMIFAFSLFAIIFVIVKSAVSLFKASGVDKVMKVVNIK